MIGRTRLRRLLAIVACAVAAAGGLTATASAATAATTPHHASALTAAAPAQAQAANPASAASNSFELINYDSLYCLGIQGGLSANGTPAVQWNCNGNPDQQWHTGGAFVAGGSTWFQLINGDGKCLGVGGGSFTAGAGLVAWTCLGSTHPDQYWSDGSKDATCSGVFAGGAFPFQNLNSGQVMGLKGGLLNEGNDVVQWNYQNACNNQFWYEI